jgi:hypothetical protein
VTPDREEEKATSTATQEQNVAAIREAYEAASAGVASKLLDLWHGGHHLEAILEEIRVLAAG